MHRSQSPTPSSPSAARSARIAARSCARRPAPERRAGCGSRSGSGPARRRSPPASRDHLSRCAPASPVRRSLRRNADEIGVVPPDSSRQTYLHPGTGGVPPRSLQTPNRSPLSGRFGRRCPRRDRRRAGGLATAARRRLGGSPSPPRSFAVLGRRSERGEANGWCPRPHYRGGPTRCFRGRTLTLHPAVCRSAVSYPPTRLRGLVIGVPICAPLVGAFPDRRSPQRVGPRRPPKKQGASSCADWESAVLKAERFRGQAGDQL